MSTLEIQNLINIYIKQSYWDNNNDAINISNEKECEAIDCYSDNLILNYAELFRRNKHQKLSEIQKDFLTNQIKTSGLLISQLSSKYFISLSTLYSLKDTLNKNSFIFANKRWNRTTYKEKLKIMVAIYNYFELQTITTLLMMFECMLKIN